RTPRPQDGAPLPAPFGGRRTLRRGRGGHAGGVGSVDGVEFPIGLRRRTTSGGGGESVDRPDGGRQAMTRGLFRLFVAVLTLLGSVVMVAGTTAVPAAAQPSGSSTTTPRFVKLAVDSVTPSTVTPASEPVLTVAGTVTNIGDRPVQDVSVRLQRAAAVSEPSQLRSTLQLDQVNFDLVGPFEDVVEELSPGQRRQFTVSIPLYSDVAASLQIIEPGVYPVLVNVNGTPAYGGQARLDDARFLLPVLGVPQFPDTHIPPSPAP